LVRQVESVPGAGKVGECDRDAHRKRESRAAAKTVVVPACEDRARRERFKPMMKNGSAITSPVRAERRIPSGTTLLES
jgi:hypothetical protein